MKYMLLIYNNSSTYESWTEEERTALFGEVDGLMAELAASGEWLGGEALVDAALARTVRVRDGVPAVTDGPFAEGKEHVGGFLVVRAPDLDAALAWGRKLARVLPLPIEVRPFQGEAEG